MASQAFSASANVLKGDPPTLMAVLFKLMGRQEATKPGFPWSPGPLLLSLLITNEKPRSLAVHISSSGVAGAIRLKCIDISRSSEPKRPRVFDLGPPTCRQVYFRPGGLWGHRPEARIRRLVAPGVPAIATLSRQRGGGLTKRKRLTGCLPQGGVDCESGTVAL
jgi:hypothetical protein